MLSLPSSSSSSISRQKYDVFLSFRGEDTRKTFTDNLYAALKMNGIVTFRDDPRLEAGEKIAPELFKAIQESWCSVIVFSETYTFSSWCLEELAEIVEQRKKRGHKIFPIFYEVDPSDLRRQKRRVDEAFAKHEERYKEDKDKIQRWRIALTEVSNIKGWHSTNRHESELIGDIVKKISAKLCQTYTAVCDELIGIDSRLEELHSKIEIGKDDVRIVGICGMGGIGKTTLARIVSPHFEGKSFLADVREVSKKCGLVSLQKQLLSDIFLEEGFYLFNNVHEGNVMISHRLSHKKVLVVIDDADNFQHLKCLIGRRDGFGLGSRIIVTTRDEHLLRSYKVDDVYKPTTLNVKESLRLFNLKAFDSDTVPENDLLELAKDVVEYTGGLPLALEVLGCFFCGRDVAQWRSAIERLKRDSNKEIHDRLQISYDGLEETEKNIFLDIACFFNGEEKDFVIKVLDGCEFFPDIGIDVLVKKSLIKVDEDNKYLRMHDLLQQMGRKIVWQKSPVEPGRRCRLWEEKDIYHVLTKNTATDVVEGMVVDYEREQNKTFTLSADAFLKMKKLRLLKVLYLPKYHDLKYLSDELRLLEWHGYPFKSLPSSFQLANLVALLLPHSRIEQLWQQGNRPLYKLKFVDINGSQNLIKTPNFEMTPNLEHLIFKGCTRLVNLHPSIRLLKRLKLLNLKDCTSLRSFSTKIGMESLETLILSGCSSLQRFPKIDGEMKCLLELYLDGTGIKELPSSIGHLCSNLVLLNLKDCSNLASLPSSIDGCKLLKTLILSGCSKVETLPENLQQIETLEELDLSGTAIRNPPSFIFQFKYLKALSVQGCKGPPSKLRSNFPSLFWVQRGSMDSMALRLHSLSGLSSLYRLNLSNCNLGEGAIPNDIFCLSSLTSLDLSGNNFISLPATLGELSELIFLDLVNCKKLKSLPKLQSEVEEVVIDGCASLEVVFEDPLPVCSSIYRTIKGINCYKLVEKNDALTMLKKQIKIFPNGNHILTIIVPGSEIPEWFNHQTDESSIKIPLPPNIGNDSRWMGVAHCCIFVSTFNDDDACEYALNDGWEDDDILGWNYFLAEYYMGSRYIGASKNNLGDRHRLQQIRKDHLSLQYVCGEYLYSLMESCGEIEIFECRLITEPKVKVKKLGIRIVYEEDLDEMEQILEQHCSPTNCADHDVAGGHGSTGNSRVLVKRKRNIYEEEGPSDQSDCPEERAHPKCLKIFLNFITGKKY